MTSGDGSKTVYCQIKNNAGLYSTLYDTIVLDTMSPSANAGSTQTVTVGKSVTLNGGNSVDNSGIVSYLWDFGDGSKRFRFNSNPHQCWNLFSKIDCGGQCR